MKKNKCKTDLRSDDGSGSAGVGVGLGWAGPDSNSGDNTTQIFSLRRGGKVGVALALILSTCSVSIYRQQRDFRENFLQLPELLSIFVLIIYIVSKYIDRSFAL